MTMAMMNKLAIPVFKFQPFSTKQKKVLTWYMPASPYRDYDAIIADGAIRSGKTVSMALSYVIWGNETFNGENLGMCGKTIGSFRRNVVQPLKRMLKSRGYVVQDHRADNLLIISNKRKDGTVASNYYYIFGGKDEASQDLIQGITLAGCFFDEVALMPESFVNQATGRCSVEGSKYWFNCNPDGPYHWFKTNWIDKKDEKLALYLHFTMDDNLSLNEKVKDRYKRMYAGIFYKRYILGLWVLAEGVIYDMFDEERNIKHEPFMKQQAERLFVSIDYGTQNPCTFGLYGVRDEHYHLFDYYYYSGRDRGKQKTDRDYVNDLIDFIGGNNVRYVTVDPSATSLIAEMRTRTFFKERNIQIVPAKNNVIKGIQAVGVKLQEGKFTIEPDCIEDKREFSAYIWDEKATQRGIDEPLKENDHCMDRNRYAVYTDSLLYRHRKNYSGKGARRR